MTESLPKCELLVDSTLGQELEKGDCDVLTSVMGVRFLEPDEILAQEGDTDGTLFVLTEGKLAVLNNMDGVEHVVYTMKTGETAGTNCFIDRRPRKATVKAVGKATVYTLTPDKFESLLDTHPKLVYKVMRALFRLTHLHLMRMNLESQQLSNYIHRTGGRY